MIDLQNLPVPSEATGLVATDNAHLAVLRAVSWKWDDEVCSGRSISLRPSGRIANLSVTGKGNYNKEVSEKKSNSSYIFKGRAGYRHFVTTLLRTCAK